MFLDRTPRYFVYFLIVYAPFCYGLRDGAGEPMFVTISFMAFFMFCWKCFLDGRWPKVDGWLLFCMAFIGIHGLWMAQNADSYYRWHRELITIRILDPAPMPDLPGSRDRLATPAHLYPQFAVFCLMIVIAEMRPIHRRRVLGVAVGSAVALALLGIVIKLGGTELLRIYWSFEKPDNYQTSFAGYRYHGNAATFLTISYAFASGFLLEAMAKGQTRIRILTLSAIIIILFGLFLNTSRAGWALAIIVTLLAIPRLMSTLRSGKSETTSPEKRRLVIVVAVAAGLIAIIALFASESQYRIGKLSSLSETMAKRFPLALFMDMVPETPLTGFGPGTFPFVFPKYQMSKPGMYTSDKFLNEAHQDYFQIYFDWGPITFLVWLTILFVPAIKYVFQHRSKATTDNLGFVCFAAVFAVLLHATLDFPLQITSLLFYFGIATAFLSKTTPATNQVTGVDAD